MSYEFGEIFDCRDSPEDHFILILGKGKKNELLYFIITSRIYKPFQEIRDFFNDCKLKPYKRFFNFFGKEKENKLQPINDAGRLCDILFLDNSLYSMTLDTDSMVVINQDPKVQDISTFEEWKEEDLAKRKDSLQFIDFYKLSAILKHSKHISPRREHQIRRNFNVVNRKYKELDTDIKT